MKRENFVFGGLAILAAILVVMMNVITAHHNDGMEGDEVFSYISATSMGGFKEVCFLDDQTWYPGEYFFNALTAEGNERFNVKMVVENQAMDTHPPLFYLFLNLVCSVFEGQYSRLFGVGLNIFFMLFAGTGLFLLLEYYFHNKYASLAFSTIFCCSHLAIGMVLFIRMYVLLMALFLFQSWYHLKLYDRMKQSEEYLLKRHWQEYGVLGFLTIVGALTHYYFLVYQCLIAALFIFGLWNHRKIKAILCYVGTMTVSGIVYVCLYPAVLEHMFFKYRGREAVHKFLKESSLFGDVIAMYKNFDEQLFKGSLLFIISIFAILTILLLVRRKIKWQIIGKGCLLILPSLIYFYGVSKASPYVSIRYVSPVAALIWAAVLVWGFYLIRNAIPQNRLRSSCILGVGGILAFLLTFYFMQTPVKASYYSEKTELTQELAAEIPYCVYITGDEYNWKMWEDFVNYPAFEGLFFIDGKHKAVIEDAALRRAEQLVIYVDKALDLDEMQEYLQEYLPLQQYEICYETSQIYILLAR